MYHQVFQDLGMLDETKRVADTAYKINPQMVEASILRGRLSGVNMGKETAIEKSFSVDYAKGSLSEAIEKYKEALELNPTSQQVSSCNSSLMTMSLLTNILCHHLVIPACSLFKSLTLLACPAFSSSSPQTLLNLGNTYGDLYRQLEAKVMNQNSEARKEMKKLQDSCIKVGEDRGFPSSSAVLVPSLTLCDLHDSSHND
eukprot:508518-Hanusia_phi.AAC.6